MEPRKQLAVAAAPQSSTTIVKQISIADELTKLAILKQQGIISEIEFTQMKQDLPKKIKDSHVHSENKSVSSLVKRIAYRSYGQV